MTRAPSAHSALDARINEATEAVAQLETLPPDQPWADPLAAAAHAIDALHEAAHVVVFPRELQPASAAAIADFDLIFQDSRYTTLLSDAIEVHDAAVATHPDLAALIRSPRLVRLLTRLELDEKAFERAVAAQLVAADQLQPHSGILAHTVPDLRRRLETQAQTRQAAARAAIDAAAETDAEIARVRQEAFQDRRRALIDRANRLPGSMLLVLPGELDPITARLLSGHLERAESPDRLDVLERAIESAAAARVPS